MAGAMKLVTGLDVVTRVGGGCLLITVFVTTGCGVVPKKEDVFKVEEFTGVVRRDCG